MTVGSPAPPDTPEFPVLDIQMPVTIRHNTQFHRWPKETAQTGLRPTNSVLAGGTSHELVADTIHRASTIGLERAGKFVMGMPGREADAREFSALRFRKTRDDARLWDELQDVFDEARGIQTRHKEGCSDDFADGRTLPWHEPPAQGPVTVGSRQVAPVSSRHDSAMGSQRPLRGPGQRSSSGTATATPCSGSMVVALGSPLSSRSSRICGV